MEDEDDLSLSDSGGPSPGPSTVKQTTGPSSTALRAANLGSASGAKRKRIERACVSCRTRRSKCDGATPCGACAKCVSTVPTQPTDAPRSGRDCEYPERKKRASMRQIQELEERLRKAEAGEFAAAQPPPPTAMPLGMAATPSGAMPPMMAAGLPGGQWYPQPYGAYPHHTIQIPPLRAPFMPPAHQPSPRLPPPPQLPLPIPSRPSSSSGPRYDVPLFLGRGSRPDERLLAKSGFDLLTEAASNEVASGAGNPRVVTGLSGADTPGGDALDLFDLPSGEQAINLCDWFFLYVVR